MDKQFTNTTTVEIPDRKTSVDIKLYYKNYGDTYMDYETRETIIPILIETVKWM